MVDLLFGNLVESVGCVPGTLQGVFDRIGVQVKVDEEILVCSVATVLRTFGRQVKCLLHERKIEPEQERAVEKEETTFATLGVAGELEAPKREIRVALN